MIKAFVLEKMYMGLDEIAKSLLEDVAQENGIAIKVDLAGKEFLEEIPVGYSFYFLHLSGISDDSLRELRKACPKSYIAIISRYGEKTLPKEIRELMDIGVDCYNSYIIEDMLEKTKDKLESN